MLLIHAVLLAPFWSIRTCFTSGSVHGDPTRIIKKFEPKLNRLQLQFLKLLGIPESTYTLAKSTLK
jgi:hypothetical protein